MTWDPKVPNDEPVPVKQTDINLSILAAALHYAICLLEKTESRIALQKLAISVSKGWVEAKVINYTESNGLLGPRQDISRVVDLYLRTLRRGTLTIVLADDEVEQASIVETQKLPTDYTYPGPAKLNQMTLNLKDFGVMVIDSSPGVSSYPRLSSVTGKADWCRTLDNSCR
jgi:hypothetical protein